MARRPLADDPPPTGPLGRLFKAVRRGAEAFREELTSAPGEGGRHSMDDPYQATIRAINAMERAPRVRVDKRAREAAVDFIASLQRRKMPVPDVGPAPGGGIAMSWSFDTDAGELELDVVFLDWHRVEYREGYAERDGFVEEAVLDEAQLRERLQRAMGAAQPVA
jgi:hypothetical protein